MLCFDMHRKEEIIFKNAIIQASEKMQSLRYEPCHEHDWSWLDLWVLPPSSYDEFGKIWSYYIWNEP